MRWGKPVEITQSLVTKGWNFTTSASDSFPFEYDNFI